MGCATKTRVCGPDGKCVPTAKAETFGTLESFGKYADEANLSIVSIQETPSPENLAKHLPSRWGVACDKHIVYRKDRLQIVAELRPPASAPQQIATSICAARVVRIGKPAHELLFVGGGVRGDADGSGDPARALAAWVDSVRGGRATIIGLDMT